MTLIKWVPRSTSIINDMDNMLSDVFNNNWNFPVCTKTNWSPPVDVKETDDSFTLTADIAGLTKKDLNVNVSNGIISISGERKFQNEKENDNYHYRERQYGSFLRTFNLPETVKEEEITANFKNGILSIEIPKEEVVFPKERQIKIS